MSEQRIQTNCINWYKRNYPNNYIRKNEQVVKAGDPDIMICHYGLFIAIEMKQPGKNPTKLQTLKLEQIRRANGRCGVAHSLKEFKDIIQRAEADLARVCTTSAIYEGTGGTDND